MGGNSEKHSLIGGVCHWASTAAQLLPLPTPVSLCLPLALIPTNILSAKLSQSRPHRNPICDTSERESSPTENAAGRQFLYHWVNYVTIMAAWSCCCLSFHHRKVHPEVHCLRMNPVIQDKTEQRALEREWEGEAEREERQEEEREGETGTGRGRKRTQESDSRTRTRLM